MSEEEAKHTPETVVITPEQIEGFIYERGITTPADKKKFAELVESVKRHGVIEDIIVRQVKDKKDKYKGVAGSMRYRAAIKAELPKFTVKAYPAGTPDSEIWLIALTENVVGVDVSPVDTGK